MGGLVFLAAMLALAGGSSSAPPPGRMDPPDKPVPPRAPPPPVTLAMMSTPQPLPVGKPMLWTREVLVEQTAVRTQTRDGTDLPVPPIMRAQLDLAAGDWLLVRTWAESDYNPSQGENQPAAATWSWSLPLKAGSAFVVPIVKQGQIPGYLPRMTWANMGIKIDIFGRLEVFLIYPGKSHTGDQRGRKYDVLVEWLITKGAPT